MKKHTWLEFENDEQLNAFMAFVTGCSWNRYSAAGSTVGSGFTKKEIKIAKKDFGGKVVGEPELGQN